MPSITIPNPYTFYIQNNVTVYAEVSIIQCLVTINQTEHQTIRVTCNGSVYTTSFTAPYFSTFTAEVQADTGWIPGTLNYSQGEIRGNMTIQATAASQETRTINIIQSDHQTIYVNDGVQDHTSSFKIPYGASYTARIVADQGWTAGTLSSSSGIATQDITISATAATQIMHTVTIQQSDHQTIRVTVGGQKYENTFRAPYGSQYSIVVEPEYGYEAGSLNIDPSGTLTSDITVSATEAVQRMCQISYNIISSIMGEDPGNLFITYNEETFRNETASGSFEIPYGTQINIDYEAPVGYDKPTSVMINSSPKSYPVSMRVEEDINITGYGCTNSQYTVTIVQTDHQTITVNDGETDHTDSFTCKYGTPITVSIEAEEGWNHGTLNYTSTTVTNNLQIEASPATQQTHWVNITQVAHQTITVNDGQQNHTTTFQAPHGTMLTVSVTVDDGYEAGALVPSTIQKDTPFELTDDITITIETAEQIMYHVTINQSLGQVLKVTDVGTGTQYTSSFDIPWGTTLRVELEANTGWTAGTITSPAIQSGETFVIYDDTTVEASAATINRYTVTIEQSENQTITVYEGGERGEEDAIPHTSNFEADYGTECTVYVDPVNENYEAGTPNYVEFTVTDNITISASPATIKSMAIYINNGPANPDTIYNTNNDGIANNNIDQYKQFVHGQIVVYSAEGSEVGRFENSALALANTAVNIPFGNTFYFEYIPNDDGYNPPASFKYSLYNNDEIDFGEDSKNYYGTTEGQFGSSGLLTASKSILIFTCNEQDLLNVKKYHVTVSQQDHQTITVNDGEETFGNYFEAWHGVSLNVSIEADDGYTAGQLSVESPVTVTSDMTIYASAPTQKISNIQIIQSPNQTIHVNDGQTDHTSSFNTAYGTHCTVYIEPEAGYDAGKLTISVPSSYRENGAEFDANADIVTIEASPATQKTYQISINNTDAAHQSVSVTKNKVTTSSNPISAVYGDSITVTVTPNQYYDAGKISVKSASNQSSPYTFTIDDTFDPIITVTISAAVRQTASIDVEQPANGRIEVTCVDGASTVLNKAVGTHFDVPMGSSVTIEAVANDGYKVDALYVDDGT